MDAKSCYAVLVIMLATSMPAFAQSVGDLSDIQAETLILRAKAARAEAQTKLRDANEGDGSTASGSSAGDTLPVVRGVYGTPGKLYATFLYANGSTVDATAGTRIPGDLTVRTLTPTRIELARNGRTFTVGFSDMRPMPAAASQPGVPGASSIPPLVDPAALPSQ